MPVMSLVTNYVNGPVMEHGAFQTTALIGTLPLYWTGTQCTTLRGGSMLTHRSPSVLQLSAGSIQLLEYQMGWAVG